MDFYSSESEKNLDLAYTIMCRKMEEQLSITTILDTKIGILVGAVAVVLGFSVPIFREIVGLNFFTAGFGVVFFSFIILAGECIKTRLFWSSPSENYIYSEQFLAGKNIDVKNQIVADMVESSKENRKALRDRARHLDISIFIAIIGLFIMVLGVLTLKLSNGLF